MQMNMKHFKKIAQDKESTTFQHKDGHQMKVLHKALSPKMRGEMASIPMAEGGVVSQHQKDMAAMQAGAMGKPVEKESEDYSASSSTPITKPSAPNANDEAYKASVQKFNAQMNQPGMAKGGEVKKYAEGTPDAPVQSEAANDTPEQIVQDAQSQATQSPPPVVVHVHNEAPNRYAQAYDDRMKFYQDNTPGTPAVTQENDALSEAERLKVHDDSAATQSLIAQQQARQQALADNDRRQALGLPPIAVPDAPGGAGGPTPASVPAGTPPVAQPEQSASGTPNYLQQGLQLGMEGLNQKYAAEKMAAQGKQAAEETALANNKYQGEVYDNTVNHWEAERRSVADDLRNQHIDPNLFWSSKTVPGQIATVLGLIVGGLGGNDPAAFIGRQIDRDIDAQKANMANGHNILNALHTQFQDLNTAAQFKKVLSNDQVVHQIDLAAAKASTPMALANLNLAKKDLLMQSGALMATVGAQQVLSNPNADEGSAVKAINQLRIMNPPAAKEAEERYVPGFGVAKVPVPQSVRDQITARTDLHVAASDLLNFIQNKGSSMSLQDRQVAEEKANVVQSLYREGLLKTVYKKGEQPLLDKVVSENPLSFVNKLLGTEGPKLKEVIKSNQRGLNTLTGSVGLKLSPGRAGTIPENPFNPKR